MGIVLGLLVLWLIVVVIGVVVKAVSWLAIVGGVLFLATALVGLFRHSQHR